MAESYAAGTRARYGQNDPEYATALNNLAQVLKAMNRLAEAEPLYRRALAIDEMDLGPENPDLATQLNNLAGLLQATNRFGEAEQLYRRALAIHEKSLGPEHQSVSIDLNNLAGLLQDTNRLAEAEPLYRRDGRRKVPVFYQRHRAGRRKSSLSKIHATRAKSINFCPTPARRKGPRAMRRQA